MKNGSDATHERDQCVNPGQLLALFQSEEKGCDSIDLCGKRIAQFYAEIGWKLIYLSLFHEDNNIDPYHIYMDVPDHISTMCIEFQSIGGCPFAREALQRLQPFEVLNHDFSGYDDILSHRYLKAFRSLGFQSVITIPIQFGEGVTVVVIGSNHSDEKAISKDLATTISYQLMVKFSAHFPGIASHFIPKKLTAREAHILSLTACGLVETEIAETLSISPHTVRTHLQNVKLKMIAKNKAHAVALAIKAHEISEPTLRTVNS